MRGHRPVAREFVAQRARGLDGDACVLWPFQVRDGYGVIRTPRPHRRSVTAHRARLDAAGIEPGLEHTEIRHLCGVRRCVNLAHLRWGTKSENQQDRFRLHGDSNHGERNPRARLTEDQVRFVLDSAETGVSLARLFEVSPSTIAMIRTRRTWTHITAVPA